MLIRYMRQVLPDGRFVESPITTPKASPNRRLPVGRHEGTPVSAQTGVNTLVNGSGVEVTVRGEEVAGGEVLDLEVLMKDKSIQGQ